MHYFNTTTLLSFSLCQKYAKNMYSMSIWVYEYYLHNVKGGLMLWHRAQYYTCTVLGMGGWA